MPKRNIATIFRKLFRIGLTLHESVPRLPEPPEMIEQCFCKVCMRLLKSPESVERGMGPVCEKKKSVQVKLQLDLFPEEELCESSPKRAQ